MNETKIEKVDNGYIVEYSTMKLVYRTLDEMLSALLLHFEGRAITFTGNSYGRVIIVREEGRKEKEMYPMSYSAAGTKTQKPIS